MIKVSIDGKPFDVLSILEWERKRVEVSRRSLSRHFHTVVSQLDASGLADYKAGLGEEAIIKAYARNLSVGSAMTNAVARLSGTRRKFSVAHIDVDFCDAKTLHQLYDDMMLNNTPANRLCSLRANPDHYVLRGIGSTTQEVMEVTGGLPFPLLFDIRYGDFDGLQSKQEEDYPIQAAGASYLKNGALIGAVRHQMRDTAQGCHVKLVVEFPALMPNANIRAHQYHLACEFYHWLSEFERRLS